MLERQVRLHPQPPAEARCLHLHLVDGPVPARDGHAGLLGHLPGEAIDERLARVDHAAGWSPVVLAAAAPVAHQEQAALVEDQPTSDQPIPHRPSVARDPRKQR